MPRICVTSPSFCKHEKLLETVRREFPDIRLNEAGKRYSGAELIEYLSEAEGAIIGTEPMTAEVIAALPQLRVVAKYGVGLDNVDVAALEKTGKALAWRGGVNRQSVAELTLCFMLGLCHNIFRTGYQLKSGEWNKNGGMLLAGRTVGLIGCGFVGESVARLLKAFDAKILIFDLLDKSEFAASIGAEIVNQDAIFERSDIVSLHVPLTELTENLINGQSLHRMKNDAFVINTSRGGVIDQQALKTALRNETIAGAALDVFASEPPEDLELLSLPSLMVTPHIAGNAREAVEAMGTAAIDGLREFFSGTV